MATVEVEGCEVGELKSGEMKEVRIGSGKALLYRIGDEYRATSPMCPHYKAPLIKGVLSQDGRIMCPWHGACFNTKTGDIEDGPSIDGLQCYETRVKGKKVFVKASEAAIALNRKPPAAASAKAAEAASVLIIGGGAGGLQTAETLRAEGFAGKITLLSREATVPVDRPKLSKTLKTTVEAVQLRDKAWFDKIGVDLQLNTEVVALDAKAKSVEVKGGKKVSYDYVVLASGGDPRTLPIPGNNLGNLHVLRTIHDATGIDAAVAEVVKAKGADYRPKVVIVGSSFIGMEAAAIFAKTADVTVIGMEKVPFERVLGADVGKAFMHMHERANVKFRMESVTEKYEPLASDPKVVGAVVIKGTGERLPADIVVLGVGVRCATDFLKASGIPLERDGSVIVEASMKVPGVEGAFAIGDIARYPYHLTGEKIRVEHWSVAQNQGRVAAENIVKLAAAKKAGGEAPALASFVTIPYFWTVQFGKSIRYAGHAESFDDVVVKALPSVENMESLEAYYIRKDQVLAVATMAKDPIASTASELLRLGLMPSGAEIKSGKDVTKIKLGDAPASTLKPAGADADDNNMQMLIIAAVVIGVIAVGYVAFAQ